MCKKPAAPPLRTSADIIDLLESDNNLKQPLQVVESLSLPDSWIGAGFIRNAIRDIQHGRGSDISSLDDVDVVFFDPLRTSLDYEAALEQQLQQLSPHLKWSVKNQARMHIRNGDGPYQDTFHAIAHWPETATAIAARSMKGEIALVAPHGIVDLLGLIVRPTPAFAAKMDIYRQRIAAKNWTVRWPHLTVLMA